MPSRPLPEPAGFGDCGVCAYLQSGPASRCYQCAEERMEELPHPRCFICDQRLKADKTCGNPLCNRTAEERHFDMVFAIAMRSGPLDRAIKRHKYQAKIGWAWIFGRVLVGYLNTEPDVFRDYDLIIPSPGYTGDGGDYDHTAAVIERAKIEDDSWPFRTDVMRKTAKTPRLADYRTFGERAHVAETKIRRALRITDSEAVRGSRVLVFDDVFTGGLTLREVGHKLRAAGARQVSGIVLARSPFRS